MMEELDELRQPTAWRLLEIWRGPGSWQRSPGTRPAVQRPGAGRELPAPGEAGVPDGAAVLVGLTAGEMETLLRRLAGEEPSPLLRRR